MLPHVLHAHLDLASDRLLHHIGQRAACLLYHNLFSFCDVDQQSFVHSSENTIRKIRKRKGQNNKKNILRNDRAVAPASGPQTSGFI
jgi:hypothetical protein